MVLAFLGLFSGFFAAWLGVGGSIFIVPLLPFLSGLDPLSAVQVSLLLIFTVAFINSLSFIIQGLVLWPWFIRGLIFSLFFAFLSGLFVSYFSSLQIRFVLWLFLLLIMSLPFLLKKLPGLKSSGMYIFSSLMGVCSGFTGLGGGLILSPYLHESHQMPAKNIPAVSSCIMFFVSFFSVLGQISHIGFSFLYNETLWFCFFLLFIPACVGLCFGYIINIRQKDIWWRKLILRIIVAVMFFKITIELVYA